MAWSVQEARLAVEDYFSMLAEEMRGRDYNKAEHRRALRLRLENRTDASVERKHQNISAVLIEMGLPYIDGYKPLGNYQQTLRDEVRSYVRQRPDAVAALAAIAESETFLRPQLTGIDGVLVEPPEFVPPREPAAGIGRTAGNSDFLEREARNMRLARLGQEFAAEFERLRLRSAGHPDLAERVEWVTEPQAAGSAFDISSFDDDGSERLILVRTTTCGRSFPFYVSRNQVAFSEERADNFLLYRVFSFSRGPRMFMLPGAISSHCRLEPQTYRASFGRVA